MALESGHQNFRPQRRVIADMRERGHKGLRRHQAAGQLPRPKADTGGRQRTPWKEMPGVLLARGRDVGMRKHVARRNIMARQNIAAKGNHTRNLLFGEGNIAERMTGILNFDTDRMGVEVGHAAPVRLPRVPCAFVFIDHLYHAAIKVNEVVRTDFFFGVAQPLPRCFRIRQVGVMQHQHARRDIGRTVVEIGRGGLLQKGVAHVLGVWP